ncbi:MAG: hypothetical protein AAFR65_04785 [Pseudomonadota bacterium]
MNLIAVFSGLFAFVGAWAAAEPITVFDQDLNVAIDDRAFSLPTQISVDQGSSEGQVHLTVRTVLTQALPKLAQFIADEIDGESLSGADLSAWNGQARLDGSLLAMSVTVRAQTKILGFNARETGTVRVGLEPYLVGNRVQLRMSRFSVDDLSEITGALGGEAALRSLFQRELDTFNNDPSNTELPEALTSRGFIAESLTLATVDTVPVLTVGLRGPNNLLSFLEALKELGAV